MGGLTRPGNIGFLFTLYICGLSGVLVRCCTDTELGVCWAPMTNLPDHLDWDVIVPTLTEENMKEHCRLYNGVKDCLNTLSCNEVLERAHEGLESAYEFLCDISFDKYLKYRECFSDPNLHDEGKYCNDTLVKKLKGLDSADSNVYKLKRICQYANDYLDCVDNAVDSFCGSEAAAWQRELDYRSLTPLLGRAGCQLDKNNRVYYPEQQPEDKTKTYIIVGCVVALSIIVLLILIALFIMMRNKKKAAANQNAHRGSTHNNLGMDYYSGDNLPPGASSVHAAGPLPMKQPPPYNEAPPEYSPYDNPRGKSVGGGASSRDSVVGGASSRHSVVGGSSSRHSVANGDARSVASGNGRRARSNAGSVYSVGSGVNAENPTYNDGYIDMSNPQKSNIGDDYF